ncbi:hypothetical protein H1S01_20445 [Heliobacterium chlorum]|uniref:Holin n=1 Tax=Heliobacterium chlorum TaxID=2698 RepID=A0ABR7T8W6_HELCL|nr:hypothetical protein [Heliobacterium chlorum]
MFESSVIVAVLIAAGQFAKMYVDSKYVPLVTMALGIIAGAFYMPSDTLSAGIFNGIIVGLSANGLFDMTKILHEKAE